MRKSQLVSRNMSRALKFKIMTSITVQSLYRKREIALLHCFNGIYI